MSLLFPSAYSCLHKPHGRCSCFPPLVSGCLKAGMKIARRPNTGFVYSEGSKERFERIRNLFSKVELSVSSYDTAWLALVPSPTSSGNPCFPECVDWLLNNQLGDGSWGPSHHRLLIKDALSSTLASVIALKRWGLGDEQINIGLHFIEMNITSAIDENQYSPIGFDIIFPGMLEYAKDLNLNLPFEPKDLDAMLHRRDLELRRALLEGRESYLAYISEGMGKLQDWEMVMKYQRKNGSLFNSPSTTAAAFMYIQDAGCLNYLHSLMDKLGNAVPTVYPLDIYARLCMVDSLEKLGIERHFRDEIKSVLDVTYRHWLQGEEEIFMDIATCAMAFRILRLNGYDVSSGPLTQITEENLESSFPTVHLKDVGAALELHRASEIIIYPDELSLEKQHSWSSDFLNRKLYNGIASADRLDGYASREVDDALKFPFYVNVERLKNRRNMEHYSVDGTSILKTSYCLPNVRNEDFLRLAVEDFNICQEIQREELKHLERWVAENRLDKLKFARQKSAYCYFSAAATLFSPELSEARLSWAKNGVLATVVDDFFDIGGSIEELENLIQLVEKWDVNVAFDCCSEHVKIIFLALYHTLSEIAANAFKFQGRSVLSHIVDIWLKLLNSMLREAKWIRDKSVPTMDEYVTNGVVSSGLGPIVLPALYFVGPLLSEETVCSAEYQTLFKLLGICGRLLNDIHSSEREYKEGKLHAVSLHMVLHDEALTAEESIRDISSLIYNQRRELLRLVLQKKGSAVPQACKDLFWKMSKVLHLFYMKDDGYSSQEMIHAVKAVIHEPITLYEHLLLLILACEVLIRAVLNHKYLNEDISFCYRLTKLWDLFEALGPYHTGIETFLDRVLNTVKKHNYASFCSGN